MTTLSGIEDREAAERRAVEHVAHGVLEHLDLDHAVGLRDADHRREVADPLGGEAAPAQARERRHPRVVPSAHVPLVDEAQEHALREDGVGEIEPGELVLVRARGHRQVLDEPVVERPVVLELQGADGVRDALDRVGLPVREVVGRVDAPRVARPRMLRVDDPVQDRVAQVDVAGGHVDLARAARAPRSGTRRRACARTGRGSPRPAGRATGSPCPAR